MSNKHYSMSDIFDQATDIGDGWKSARIILGDGETAVCPGSTKWVFQGPGEVAYSMNGGGMWVSFPNGEPRRVRV
jgi:hypothetical protein